MRYRKYLTLFLLSGFFACSAVAQESRYRVELIVLTHLDHIEEPREALQLPDYSTAIDFLTPVPEEAETDGENAENDDGEAPSDAETPQEIIAETTEEGLSEEPEVEVDPNRVVHIEEMSGVMQESWRRLRLSAPFRPQIYLSWEQGGEEPFPSLRLHDLETVMVDDPWADLRAELLEQEASASDTDAVDSREEPEEVPAQPSDAEGEQADDEASGEPPIPDPIAYYRLDGTASLKRTRFLHMEFDLQLREAVWDPAIDINMEDPSGEPEKILPSSFLVYSMKQSRQVRTGRMEYFDGPVLGVLVYITSIETAEDSTDEGSP